MTYYYMDTDAADDLGTGADWANAVKVLETLIALMSAGDIGVVQGAAADTSAITRSLTSPGVSHNGCLFIAVADGTTNAGTSIVEGDLAAAKSQVVSCTGNSDFTLTGHGFTFIGFAFSGGDQTNVFGYHTFYNCSIAGVDVTTISAGEAKLYNTDLINANTQNSYTLGNTGKMFWKGGTYVQTAAPSVNYTFERFGDSVDEFHGVDFSQITKPICSGSTAGQGAAQFKNCLMPASYTLYATPTSATTRPSWIEIIASSDATGIANSASVQDYSYQDEFGNVDLESTNIRTGAADDGTGNVFCYAMTPITAKTAPSVSALRSPVLSTWVAGGSEVTCTVFIANDVGANLTEDEVWIDWITPDDSAGDTAQHDIDVDIGRLFNSSTDVTVDGDSSWVTAANPQKFVKTFTPGYEGWIQARVYFAKTGTDTLYLDPKIEVAV